MSRGRWVHNPKLTNAGADGPELVKCLDCGWTGRRVYPKDAAFQAKPCPKCGSREIVLKTLEPSP